MSLTRDIRIGDITTPARFYVYPNINQRSERTKGFQEVTKLLNQGDANSYTFQDLDLPIKRYQKEEVVVSAKIGTKWFRALIKSTKAEPRRQVAVFLIDFGITKIVNIDSHLRPITKNVDEISDPQPLAYEFVLSGLVPLVCTSALDGVDLKLNLHVGSKWNEKAIQVTKFLKKRCMAMTLVLDEESDDLCPPPFFGDIILNMDGATLREFEAAFPQFKDVAKAMSAKDFTLKQFFISTNLAADGGSEVNFREHSLMSKITGMSESSDSDHEEKAETEKIPTATVYVTSEDEEADPRLEPVSLTKRSEDVSSITPRVGVGRGRLRYNLGGETTSMALRKVEPLTEGPVDWTKLKTGDGTSDLERLGVPGGVNQGDNLARAIKELKSGKPSFLDNRTVNKIKVNVKPKTEPAKGQFEDPETSENDSFVTPASSLCRNIPSDGRSQSSDCGARIADDRRFITDSVIRELDRDMDFEMETKNKLSTTSDPDSSAAAARSNLRHVLKRKAKALESDVSTKADSDFSGSEPKEPELIKVERQQEEISSLPTIFTQGRPVKPISNIKALKSIWNQYLVKVLVKKDVNQLMPLQKALFPAITKFRSIIGIGKSGKTTSYLLPIMNALLTEPDYPQPPNEHPLAVIVAPTWKVATSIHQLYYSFANDLDSSAKVVSDGTPLHCVTIYENEERFRVDLLSGSHILIVTPKVFLRLSSGEFASINFSRCCHLVFDDADVILEHFPKEFLEIVTMFKKSGLSNPEKRNQLVMVANAWTRDIQMVWTSLTKTFAKEKGPVIALADALNASVVGKIRNEPEAFSCTSAKVKRVLELVSQAAKAKKEGILIACKDNESGLLLESALQNAGQSCHLLKHLSASDQVWGASNTLQSYEIALDKGLFVPLIVTDKAIAEPVQDFTEIIHFDYFTPKSFKLRYYHLAKCFQDPYNESSSTIGVSRLLMSPEDSVIFNTIRRHLRLFECTIPDSVNSLFLAKKLEEVMAKKESNICQEVKLLGKCRKQEVCKNRHFFFPEADIEKGLKLLNQTILFRVRHIESLVHFFVTSESEDRSKSHMTEERAKLKQSLCSVQTPEAVPSDELKHHQLYLAQASVGDEPVQYHRVEILNWKDGRRGKELRLLLVDEGQVKSGSFSLWKLPSHLDETAFPRQAFEVVVTALVPKDNDMEWSHHSLEYVEKVLMPQSDSAGAVVTDLAQLGPYDPICRGFVGLSLGHTVWIDQMELVHFDRGSWIPFWELKKSAISKKFADVNEHHTSLLVELCKKAKIEDNLHFVRPEKSPNMKPVDVKNYRKAFLELTSFREVFVSEVISPNKFYVRQEVFSPQLMALEKDLMSLSNVKAMAENSIRIGAIYFINFEDDLSSRCRVQVISKNDDGKFCCFMVDYGITRMMEASEIFPLPGKFITVLPFQAIECKLSGVLPLENESDFSVEAGDFLFQYCLDKQLLVKPLLKDGDCYVVILLNVEAGESVEDAMVAAEVVRSLDMFFSANSEAEFFIPSDNDEPLGQGVSQASPNPSSDEEEESPVRKSDENKSRPPEKQDVDNETPVQKPWTNEEDVANLQSISFQCPGPAIVSNVTPAKSSVPISVTFYQKKESIIIELRFDLKFDMNPKLFHLDLTSSEIFAECLEVTKVKESDRECYFHHAFPRPLPLASLVDPQETVITYLGTGARLSLKKAVPAMWRKIFINRETGRNLRYPWLTENVSQESDDEELGVVLKPTSYHRRLSSSEEGNSVGFSSDSESLSDMNFDAYGSCKPMAKCFRKKVVEVDPDKAGF